MNMTLLDLDKVVLDTQHCPINARLISLKQKTKRSREKRGIPQDRFWAPLVYILMKQIDPILELSWTLSDLVKVVIDTQHCPYSARLISSNQKQKRSREKCGIPQYQFWDPFLDSLYFNETN